MFDTKKLPNYHSKNDSKKKTKKQINSKQDLIVTVSIQSSQVRIHEEAIPSF